LVRETGRANRVAVLSRDKTDVYKNTHINISIPRGEQRGGGGAANPKRPMSFT